MGCRAGRRRMADLGTDLAATAVADSRRSLARRRQLARPTTMPTPESTLQSQHEGRDDAHDARPAHDAGPGPAGPLLRPGDTCWRIEQTHRLSVLVDAQPYFTALREALREARRSVFILGWDIDSRTRLVPEGANDGLPEPLGDFLHEIVARRRGLRVYVLSWDFAMIYALEREWMPVYKLGWRTHRRLTFRLDGRHPPGGSHHQKVVVIDDALAFVGGFDLTRSRWDTAAHRPNDPLRRDPDGKPYGPFHDVQAVLDGDAARALGELARDRWRRATGRAVGRVGWLRRRLERRGERRASARATPDRRGRAEPTGPWPASVAPLLRDVRVGIVRTEPQFDGAPGVHESRALHLGAIARARRTLFFENQYFTGGEIGDALAARLREADGPEVVVIGSRSQSGWLEKATMGALRARLHARLRAADLKGRYRMLCPHVPGLGQQCLNVHSKVMTVDDALLYVGSANLSNRSMVLDTECGIAVEAEAQDSPAAADAVRAAAAQVRHGLLAEHLDVAPETVARHEAGAGTLAAIEALRRPGQRTLDPLEPTVAPELDAMVSARGLFDPEQPIDADELVEAFVPPQAKRPLPGRMVALGLAAIALAVLGVAWRHTPLAEWINLQTLAQLGAWLDAMPFTPVAVVAGFVVAGVVAPITLLIVASGLVFGPYEGAAYAIGGALASAASTYGLGHWMGRDAVRRLAGTRINALSKRIARRGVIAVAVIRLLPIAPFTVVNMAAGASHISLRDFLLGTLVGMAPGIVLTVAFVHNLASAAREPSFGAFAALSAAGLALIGAAVMLRRWVRRHDVDDADPAGPPLRAR